MIQFYSQANQDEFVYNILNKQTNGIFVDIGSNDPIYWNNTYFLESIGWNGICIDTNHYDYSHRRSKFYQTNALEINYRELFKNHKFPAMIDYLSIDIDEYCADCLEKIPLDIYRFKVITIEHDSYRFGDSLKLKEHKLLFEKGYDLMCANITCLPLQSDQYFEDWWVDPNYIDLMKFNNIRCEKELCTNIIKKFKN